MTAEDFLSGSSVATEDHPDAESFLSEKPSAADFLSEDTSYDIPKIHEWLNRPAPESVLNVIPPQPDLPFDKKNQPVSPEDQADQFLSMASSGMIPGMTEARKLELEHQGVSVLPSDQEIIAGKVHDASLSDEQLQALGFPKWTGPVERALVNVAGGFSDPENLLWMGAPGGAGKILQKSFLAQMTVGAAEKITSGTAKIVSGDHEGGVQDIVEGALTGALPALAARGGRVKAADKFTPTESTPTETAKFQELADKARSVGAPETARALEETPVGVPVESLKPPEAPAEVKPLEEAPTPTEAPQAAETTEVSTPPEEVAAPAAPMADSLITSHEGLAKDLADQFQQIDNQQARSVSLGALQKASESFDPDKGAAFSTYATNVIKNALRNELDKQNALKRGGGVEKVPLDAEADDSGPVAESVKDQQAESPELTAHRADVDRALENGRQSLTGDQRDLADAHFNETPISDVAKSKGWTVDKARKEQIKALKTMFEKSGLTREDIQDAYGQNSLSGALMPLSLLHPGAGEIMAPLMAMEAGKAIDRAGGLSAVTKGFRGWLGGLAGKTFPKITSADRASGEKAARWISSRIAAKPLGTVFSADVLKDLGVEAKSLGIALSEDNLRSVADSTGKPAFSFIGKAGSPFRTEAEYQAFLSEPATKEAIRRHIALWEAKVEPMYRKAQEIDPSEVLPPRGKQTGARVNLMAVDPSAPVPRDAVFSVGRGNLLGTLRRKSPFGVRATGEGQAYNGNYIEMMQNTFGRQLEIANKNDFENELVKSGNAIIDAPGQQHTLGGEGTTAFPLKRQKVVIPSEEHPTVVSQNKMLYVKNSLAGEYRIGANTDANQFSGPILREVSNITNKMALAGLTDASVHASNLATALFNRPSVVGNLLADSFLSLHGRADIPFTMVKAIAKGFQENSRQLSELAEIGALRDQHSKMGAWNKPFGYTSDFIQWADRTTRLVLDDTYHSLVKQGLAKDTETNRREFVNQVGQYNKRAQTALVRAFRDSGVGPFITAGKTFNTLGIRTATLNPGVEASGVTARLAMSANMAAKWVGAAVLVGTANYLLTKDKDGGVLGRPGVKLGNIDTGKTDENGRPLSIPVFDLIGLGRGLRVTGVKGFLEAKKNGLTTGTAFDSAGRDMVNAAISPYAGPVAKAGMAAISGYPTAINVGRSTPAAAPGESQFKENVKGAVEGMNPLVASYAASQAPGGSWREALLKQLPRFTLVPSQPPDMMDRYPEIVRKAQLGAYIDYVVHQARYLSPEERIKYVDAAASHVADEDRKHFDASMKHRRVFQ